MGLFDFARDLGKKLFGSDAEAAPSIQESIESDNPGIEGLDVSFEDGVVNISGKATSAEALEKAILMAGNVKGVTDVRIDGMDAPTPAEDVQYYIIESGDSLSKIAKTFYGNAMDYPKLVDANKEVIKDADLIYPGQKIRIPAKTW